MKKLLLLFALLGFSIGIYAQVTKTVNLATTGTLSSVLTADELNTVTNLTLTGNLDARDFKTMRENMPVLAMIDLGNVQIQSYAGTEGTSEFVTSYPANSIPDYAFWNRTTHKELVNIKTVVFPKNIESIGTNAFRFCSGILSFSIPESVISIGTQAFQDCDGIVSFDLPQNLTSISGSAFSTCKNLETVNFSDHLQSIGESAFSWCQKLKTIKIPATVTSIGDGAFDNCTALTSIYADPLTPPEITSSFGFFTGIFYDVNKGTCTLYVPVGSESKYATARYWKDFLHIITTNNLWMESSFKIYPNPVTGSTTIDLGEVVDEPAWLEIYGIQGNLLIQQQLNGQKTVIDLSKLIAGSYLIKLKTSNNIQSRLIIKK